MAKTDSFSHSSLTSMLRDHKKHLLSRDKLLLGCDAQAKTAQDLSELDEQDLWDLDHQSVETPYSTRQEVEYHHRHPLISKINIPQQQQQQTAKVFHRQQSAPMNVPDWSKILGTSASSKDNSGFFDYDDEEDEDQRIPPHEVVARDYARSHVMTFSVHEGAGHTLKGRDMSRVRNAVLKQTGFL